MMKLQVIHIKDAILLLESGMPVDISVWKLSTGDIIEYKQVKCVKSWWRGGTHTVHVPTSNVLREFRDITLFKINGMEVYL